ncbi:MAG TPA: hypothetical protein VGM92_01695, partial [Candidatus Kapabacteria bacterium]
MKHFILRWCLGSVLIVLMGFSEGFAQSVPPCAAIVPVNFVDTVSVQPEDTFLSITTTAPTEIGPLILISGDTGIFPLPNSGTTHFPVTLLPGDAPFMYRLRLSFDCGSKQVYSGTYGMMNDSGTPCEIGTFTIVVKPFIPLTYRLPTFDTLLKAGETICLPLVLFNTSPDSVTILQVFAEDTEPNGVEWMVGDSRELMILPAENQFTFHDIDTICVTAPVPLPDSISGTLHIVYRNPCGTDTLSIPLTGKIRSTKALVAEAT